MNGTFSRATSNAAVDASMGVLPTRPVAPLVAASLEVAGLNAVAPAIPVNKRAVAQSFSRAAHHYDQVAQLQMQVGQQLLAAIATITSEGDYRTALDIGCGTGKLTRQLQPFCQRLIALDLAPGMLEFARAHHGDVISDFICADADTLPFATHSLDLVFSNFALQWSACLPQLVSRLFDALKPDGQLLFSIPADGTLWELQQSWQQADPLHRHVNAFLSEADVKGALLQAGFQIDALQIDTVVMHYASVREFTHELKTLGAHTVNGEHNRPLTGKAAVARMLDAYERLRLPDGRLPATWNILRAVVRKPASPD